MIALLPAAGALAGWVIGQAMTGREAMTGRGMRHSASGILPVLLALAAGQELQAEPWQVAAVALLALLLSALWATDALRRVVPDSLTAALILSGLLVAATGIGTVPLPEAAICAIAYPAAFILADRTAARLSGASRRMPVGDALLLAGIGAWAGLDQGLAWLCATSLLFCLTAILTRRRALPLAPFIATGLPVLVAIHALQI